MPQQKIGFTAHQAGIEATWAFLVLRDRTFFLASPMRFQTAWSTGNGDIRPVARLMNPP